MLDTYITHPLAKLFVLGSDNVMFVTGSVVQLCSFLDIISIYFLKLIVKCLFLGS